MDILLKEIYKDCLLLRIDNPVFPHTRVQVQVQLFYVVMAGITRGHNLNNPVRGASAAMENP